MSGGTSGSSGTESSNTNSRGTRTGTSLQDSNQHTVFSNTTTGQTKAPLWSQTGNRALFNDRASASGEATDFLTGLLSNPLDETQPKNRYSRALDDLFSSQLTRARSGDAQSLGIGKQAIREAAALTGAQTSAINTGASAANSLLTNASPYASLDFARLISPNVAQSTGGANTVGKTQTQSDEVTTGQQQTQGQSSGSNSGFGITLCCFIFLEHYHGNLPWYVRRCRDEFCSGRRVSGYRRMAVRLVPMMRKSALVRSMVWWLMIRPMTRFGGWLYDDRTGVGGWLYAPVTAFWFGFWAMLGRKETTND